MRSPKRATSWKSLWPALVFRSTTCESCWWIEGSEGYRVIRSCRGERSGARHDRRVPGWGGHAASRSVMLAAHSAANTAGVLILSAECGRRWVVVLAPVLDHDARLGQAGELLDVEQLVADAGVEGLHERVLPRRARLDEHGPGLRELTPVAAARARSSPARCRTAGSSGAPRPRAASRSSSRRSGRRRCCAPPGSRAPRG